MAVLAKIPTTDIHWVDIRDTLNANGGNVTNAVHTAFALSANINWGARFKPTPFPKDFPTESDKAWQGDVSDNTYYRNRCGIDYPVYTSTSSLTGVINVATLWKHHPPAGGEKQPFRLLDFAGYNPSARSIIASAKRYPESGGMILLGQASSGNVAVTFNNNLNTDAIDYTEIAYHASYSQWLKDCYFGLIAISSDGRSHGVITMDYTMTELNSVSSGDYASTNDHYVFLLLSKTLFQKASTYNIYPAFFFSKWNTSATESAIAISDGFIPLPVTPISVQVASISSIFALSNLSASVSSSYGGYLTVHFTFTNKWENQIIISPNMNGKLKIKAFPYTGYPSDYPDKTYTEETIQTAYTVPPNSSINISHQMSGVYIERGEKVDLQVIFTFGSDQIQISNAFMDPF